MSPPGREGALPSGAALPVTFLAALFLLATGRWGSYIGLPGGPVYAGDVLVVISGVQTVRAVGREGTTPTVLVRALNCATIGLLLALALGAWAVLRLLVGIEQVLADPLTGARDVAPYAYAVVGMLAFLLPTRNGSAQRRLIYGALTFHALWIVTASHLPGWPWAQPMLGGAAVFTSRPDVDSAVSGVAIALAVHEWGRATRWSTRVATLSFVALNGYALQTLPTRSGFIAAVVAVGAVVGTRYYRAHSSGQRSHVIVASLLTVALTATVAIAVIATPPGRRLIEGVAGLTGEQTQASGTVDVRMFVWRELSNYITADFGRSAFGVGFGPDFLHDSNTEHALEDDVYDDVRSPHNIVLGTSARLGLGGGLLIVILIITNCALALRTLVGTRPGDRTVDTLACLVLLSTPVVSMLGVVLESPFGAIPYFWAVGQLSRSELQRRHEFTVGESRAAVGNDPSSSAEDGSLEPAEPTHRSMRTSLPES